MAASPAPATACPLCRGAQVIDDKWGMAWPMLIAAPDPEIRVEIDNGIVRPTPCWQCSGPAHPDAHAQAEELVREIRRGAENRGADLAPAS